MYHPIRKCGVLTDFDLTVFAWLTRVPGTNRTGTIPFMALELLQDQYWKGNITRRYHHELEAFMWMLPFVFLAYDNGKFDRKAPFVVDWMTSDHNTCREKKVDFAVVQFSDVGELVKPGFKDYETLMSDACLVVQEIFTRNKKLAYVKKQASVAQLKGGSVSPQVHHINQSIAMWAEFTRVLSNSGIETTRLEQHRPAFEPARNQHLFMEMKGIHESHRRVRSPHVL